MNTYLPKRPALLGWAQWDARPGQFARRLLLLKLHQTISMLVGKSCHRLASPNASTMEAKQQSGDQPSAYWKEVAMGVPLRKLSLAEFLAWEEQQPGRHEFFGGETFAMVGGTARHNRVILNLASRIGSHLDGTSCQVFAETMKAQLADSVLYPDVMVTCGTAVAGDEQAITDPLLVIEVLSPSTKGYDKRDKFILYRSLASLREYVLIDPALRQVEVFTLASAGAWMFTDQTREDTLSLESIDFKLPMAMVFRGVEGKVEGK